MISAENNYRRSFYRLTVSKKYQSVNSSLTFRHFPSIFDNYGLSIDHKVVYFANLIIQSAPNRVFSHEIRDATVASWAESTTATTCICIALNASWLTHVVDGNIRAKPATTADKSKRTAHEAEAAVEICWFEKQQSLAHGCYQVLNLLICLLI